MRNHDEKSRDIARSILPSTTRRAARLTKRHENQVVRKRRKDQMRRAMAFVDDIDEFPEAFTIDRAEFDCFNDWFSGNMVSRRRDHDKIGPVRRWAKACVARDPHLAAMDPTDREAYFAAILGQTKAGRHALSHLWDIIEDR